MISTEPSWRASRRQQLQIALIGGLGYPAIHLLGRTWRWRTSGLEHLERVYASGRFPIMAFWHGRILPALYFFRHKGIVVITSDNFDGEWIARIIHRFGYRTVRGSTSRNAARAALRAKRTMEEGHAVGITLDGPRGPLRKAQMGAAWLAKSTGNPIVPFHAEASSRWTAPSWDETQVPLPFSRVALAVGEPVHVPPDADDEALAAVGRQLESVLDELRMRALADLGMR
ncbi:MAG TPA: lysophospholipid acyltransferase family protein [Vicinamibacterales bacterium]|nr:lysophospholipid acyltransferase family protein [Vicinamibacterales bacterium]